MDELNIQVVRGFGFKPHNIMKHKSCYICITDKGTKVIKKVSADQERSQSLILFQHQVKECLYNNGFCNIDRFNLSVKNQPFYILEGNIYISTNHLQYKESNFANEHDFKKVVAKIAQMHFLLNKCAIKNSFGIEQKYLNVDMVYAISSQNLASLKKRIARSRQFTDFDVLYYKNYGYYAECLDKWYELIKKTNFQQMQKDAVNDYCIVHNMLKGEYLLINNDDVYVTNFSDCSYGHCLVDLCALIKRHFKSVPESPVNIKEILQIYGDINPISKKEIGALYALLLFPDKFIKICTQYYAKKRTWIPGTFKSRIELTIDTKNNYRKFIDEIYC